MDSRKIKRLIDKFRPWIQKDTCFSRHPLDEKQFNKSLKDAISYTRRPYGIEYYRKAFNKLVDEYHPNYDKSEKDKEIERYSSRAAYIHEFIRTIS